MADITFMMVSVTDPGFEGRTMDFEFELTEKIVKDYIDNSSKDYGKFECHDIDEWAEILEKDPEFVSYIEEVYETEIEERSCHHHHISEFDN